MAFMIPRVLIDSQIAASGWQTIDVTNDVSPNASTILLEYRLETESNTPISVKIRENSSSPEFHLIKGSTTENTKCSVVGGQGFVSINPISKSFEIMTEGDGFSGNGLSLKIVGEIKRCPSDLEILPGFGDEITSGQFINALTADLDYRLPEGTVMTGLSSTFDTAYDDRRWKAFYRPVTLPATVTFGVAELQTVFENSYKGILDYRVPTNSVIVGLYSEYSAGDRDRKWKIRFRNMESPPDLVLWGSEKITPFLNALEDDFDYRAPFGEVITGFYSEFDNTTGDRRWKIRTRAIAFLNPSDETEEETTPI